MNRFEKNLLHTDPEEVKTYNGFEVRYMDPNAMGSFFGYALKDTIFVSKVLSKRVEAFVVCHEKYHLTDKSKWLGWFGAELRANVCCGVKDPLGLTATVLASLSIKRLKLYLKLIVGADATG